MTISIRDFEKINRENQLLREQVQDYQKLYQVLEAVSSSLQVNDLIEHITREALQLCQADQGSIVLFDPSGQSEAKTLFRQAESAEEIQLDHFLNMMLGGWVSKHGRPLLTNQLNELVGESNAKNKYRKITSCLSVPLHSRGELIGVLNLIRLSGAPFAERELQLLTILGTIFGQFIHNAKFHDEIFAENLRLRQEVQQRYDYHGIIGQSPQMKALFALLERVIPTDARVLIEGESGTGKELIARAIHYSGPRAQHPFVAVDCGALPANLLEGELFGYLKGAFTGAIRDKKGLFELADGGTLFLDEIVNMPPEVQSKFLRAIQEGEIRPLGSTRIRRVNVRIISAASSNLQEKLQSGEFRQDLFYRLNVVTIKLPALRERQGDVPILAKHFLEKLSARHGKSLKGFQPETMALLEAYHWPGNVRELENIVERMVILAEDAQEMVSPDLLPLEIRPAAPGAGGMPPTGADAPADIKSRKESYEKNMLLDALTRNHWNQSAAARDLGISERSVRYKMKKLGIQKPQTS